MGAFKDVKDYARWTLVQKVIFRDSCSQNFIGTYRTATTNSETGTIFGEERDCSLTKL